MKFTTTICLLAGGQPKAQAAHHPARTGGKHAAHEAAEQKVRPQQGRPVTGGGALDRRHPGFALSVPSLSVPPPAATPYQAPRCFHCVPQFPCRSSHAVAGPEVARCRRVAARLRAEFLSQRHSQHEHTL